MKRSRMLPGSLLRATFAATAALVLNCCLWENSARAQQQALPQPKRALAAKRSEIIQGLQQQNVALVGNPLFDDYFKQYVFPHLFLPEKHNDLPQVRKTFFRPYYTAARSGPLNDRLNALTLEVMQQYVAKVNDPVIRYNAALVIGDLNEKQPEPGGKPVPVPLYEALPALLGYLDDLKMIDAVKVAALVSIQRHADSNVKFPMREDLRAKVVQAMTELAGQSKPPEGRSIEGHEWFRVGAAGVLGTLGDPGVNAAAIKALQTAMNEPDASLDLRSAMAQALGELKYPPAAKIDYKALANDMGHLAVETCNTEIEHADDTGQTPSRRRVKHHLHRIETGLTGNSARSGIPGVGPGSSPDGAAQKKFIDTVAEKVAELMKLCDDEKFGSETSKLKLDAQLADLQRALIPKAAPAGKQDTAAAAPSVAKPDAATPDAAATSDGKRR